VQVSLGFGVQALICGDGASFEAPRELPREDVRIHPEQQRRRKIFDAPSSVRQSLNRPYS
jgi:hypothetical protein